MEGSNCFCYFCRHNIANKVIKVKEGDLVSTVGVCKACMNNMYINRVFYCFLKGYNDCIYISESPKSTELFLLVETSEEIDQAFNSDRSLFEIWGCERHDRYF